MGSWDWLGVSLTSSIGPTGKSLVVWWGWSKFIKIWLIRQNRKIIVLKWEQTQGSFLNPNPKSKSMTTWKFVQTWDRPHRMHWPLYQVNRQTRHSNSTSILMKEQFNQILIEASTTQIDLRPLIWSANECIHRTTALILWKYNRENLSHKSIYILLFSVLIFYFQICFPKYSRAVKL